VATAAWVTSTSLAYPTAGARVAAPRRLTAPQPSNCLLELACTEFHDSCPFSFPIHGNALDWISSLARRAAREKT